jgi:hypothetical protein
MVDWCQGIESRGEWSIPEVSDRVAQRARRLLLVHFAEPSGAGPTARMVARVAIGVAGFAMSTIDV